MSTTSSSHRKSRSTSSFFRRSSLSPAQPLSSAGPPLVPLSPIKKPPSSTTRLSCLFIPPPDGSDRSSDELESIILQSRRGSAKLSASGSASNSPVGSPGRNGARPSLSKKGARPPSIFGGLKNLRFSEDEISGGNSDVNHRRSGSFMGLEWTGRDDYIDIGKNRTIVHHGEAQTNSGLWRKKREYLVLTDTHLVRFKSLTKAAETFHTLPQHNHRNSFVRHGSSPSVDCEKDSISFMSDTSGERATAIPLEQIVAVLQPDEGRQIFTVEITYLDKELGQGCSITLQVNDAQSRDSWLRNVRQAANRARLQDVDPIPQRLSEYAARAVEREQDYDITRFKIYKVTKRASGKHSNRSSTDDSMKMNTAVCFLVIGIHKVHLMVVPKMQPRQSSPALADFNDGGSFGILNLTWIFVSGTDDSFSLSFRSPFQSARSFQLASLAASEIAVQLRHRDSHLRPEWLQRPFAFTVPAQVEDEHLSQESINDEDHNCFDRTLTAFCVAYGVNASSIRYSINYNIDDSPRFELLQPAHPHSTNYSPLELLAIFRSLRFNESFTSLSFAHVNLDVLNKMNDPYGLENICATSKYGTPVNVNIEDQQDAPLLVQEVRALAMGNQRLRRLDFSGCLSTSALPGHSAVNTTPLSCGIIEALYPLCRDQATNVDWLVLNRIRLTKQDFASLIGLVSDRSCHLRAVEVSNCGLTDDEPTLLLDALGAQSNTLEALDISNNRLRISALNLRKQLTVFGFIRKLDLSNLTVDSSIEALLPLKVLCSWRLEDLRLRGVKINLPTLEALNSYLAHPQSQILQELNLSKCGLDGNDVATLMQSMTQEPDTARYLHLDVSENSLHKKHDQLISAIGRGLAPTHLSMRSIEYDQEESYTKLLLALASNRSIRLLDISKVSLPGEASKETLLALSQLFAENRTLEEIDVSGEHSRLEVSRIGTGIYEALRGLENNTTLQILKIQQQHLGLQGANSLADILKVNTTLRELHCNSNGITLSGFTDLVNALVTNTTLQYLPSLEEGKDAALCQTEAQIKDARIKSDSTLALTFHHNSRSPSSSTPRLSTVRRSFAKSTGSIKTHSRSGSSSDKLSGTSSKVGAVPQWTDKDVQTALRLVSEGWEVQAMRLRAFLQRNWWIANGVTPEDAAAMAGIGEVGNVNLVRGGATAHAAVPVGAVENEAPISLEASADTDDVFSPPKMVVTELLGPEVGDQEGYTITQDGPLDVVDIDRTPVFEEADFDFGPTGTVRGVKGGRGLGISKGGVLGEVEMDGEGEFVGRTAAAGEGILEDLVDGPVDVDVDGEEEGEGEAEGESPLELKISGKRVSVR